MDEALLSTASLQSRGYTRNQIAAMCRNGELVSVRRGVYVRPASRRLSIRAEHDQLVRASLAVRSPAAVLSHASAGVLQGLPIWKSQLGRVHFTVDRSSGGNRNRLVHVHPGPLLAEEVHEVDGLLMTTPARTVADLARTLPYDQAVAAGDAALSQGMDRDAARETLLRMTRMAGITQARRVIDFIDGRSESPGESLSRITLCDLGLAPMELQLRVYDAGEEIARSDFGWSKRRTLGEFDGEGKYSQFLKPGQTSGDVLFAEKRREDRLRDLGWQIVRWVWSELRTPWVIRDRLERAFARSGR